MVQAEYSLADYQSAAHFIQERSAHRPTIALILGTGLGPLADAVQDATSVPYADIPGWPRSQVIGHGNRLVLGSLEGKPIMVMQGRSHFYEGWTPAQAVFPVRVMQACGIRTLIVSNAAGALNPDIHAGDLMLLTDHINVPGLVGFSPLRGPNDESLGPRFPDMTVAYDRGLRALAERIAGEKGVALRKGVYVGLAGPAFETPAEVRMLRALGGDAVGMSTVNEVTVARHAGMRVLGFSGITNVCISEGDAETTVNHEEVLDVGSRIAPRLMLLLRGVIAQIG